MLLSEVKYLVTIRGGQVPCYYQRRSSTLLLSEEANYYQRRSNTLLLSEEVKYLVTISGSQVPLLLLEEVKYLCYYQRRSSTFVTIRGQVASYYQWRSSIFVTIRRGQVAC